MSVIDISDKLQKHTANKYKTRLATAIKQIVIHHSATKPISVSGQADAEAFARYHVIELGWPGIGYHYVIGKDGTVLKTNPNSVSSYHAGKANATSLGVCLVGVFDIKEPPQEQWEAALRLTRELMGAYGIPAERVIGHREVPAAKSCPGNKFDMNAFRRCLT